MVKIAIVVGSESDLSYIAAAGLSATLPGFIASHTTLPVIGIPVVTGPLNGVVPNYKDKTYYTRR